MSDPKLLQVKMQGRMRTGTQSSSLPRGPDRFQNIQPKDSDSEESEDNDSAHHSQINLAPTQMDWTPEEQAIVFKYYGLDALFPKKWTEDGSIPLNNGNGNSNVQQNELLIKKPAGPEQDKSDPLKIKDAIIKIKGTPKYKGQDVSVFISDKNFHSKTFLTRIHQKTDFKQLEQGLSKLKSSINEKSDSAKGIVKKHFAKFVNAKSTIDSFYKEMKNKNLISRQDFGIQPFMASIQELETSALQLYGPVLERRSKADKIRITLSILEQWKFFFNLASNLSEMVKMGRYDAAVRDYKKGKYLMQSSFDTTLEPLKENKNDKFMNDGSALLPRNYKSVFEKLWSEVERVVGEVREEMFKSLSVMSNPIDTQEKIMSYLVELDSKRDPIWCYLETQYNYIIDNCVSSYEGHSEVMDAILAQSKNRPIRRLSSSDSLDVVFSTDSLNMLAMQSRKDTESANSVNVASSGSNLGEVSPSAPWKLNDIKNALNCVKMSTFDTQFGKELLVCYWKQTLKFLTTVCEILSRHLPLFCKTCKLYTESKQKKNKQIEQLRKQTGSKRLKDSQLMMNNIFGLFHDIASLIFAIEKKIDSDDHSEAASIKDFMAMKEITGSMLSLLPLENDKFEENNVKEKYRTALEQLNPLIDLDYLSAHPLMVIHYSVRIMELLNKCHSDIKPHFISDDNFLSAQNFTDSVESIRDNFIDRISSAKLHEFEDWTFENNFAQTSNPNIPIKPDCTLLMKLSHSISKFILQSLAIFLGKGDPQLGYLRAEKIKSSFFESMFRQLDGMEWEITFWRDPECLSAEANTLGYVAVEKNEILKSTFPSKKFGQFIPGITQSVFEATTPNMNTGLDARSFMVLSNLRYMSLSMLPKLSKMLSTKYQVSVSGDLQYLNVTLELLEKIIIANYTKKQNELLKHVVKRNIFFSGLDWSCLQSPHEIRHYCYTILHHLVYVHASISEVSKSLVNRVMQEIVLLLTQELLLAFRQVDRFNIAGMLQATLEMEYLQSMLKAYETTTSANIFTQIYETLERATDPEDKIEPSKMNEFVGNVKQYLLTAKTTTFTQFRSKVLMAILKSQTADIDPTTVRLALDNVEILFDPILKEITTGTGKLTITDQFLVWNNEIVCLSIDYPSILMHAISRQDPVTQKPLIYCQLDDSLCQEEDLAAFEMKLLPADESQLEAIYNALAECSALHPDPQDDLDLNGDGWVTAENVDSFNTSTGLFDKLLDEMESQDNLNSNGKRENSKDLLR
ncbi:hypothetical protein HDV01_003360 [Terramyces sp. JEL0728]|nr:hypothetical protein HDV01_003360 [Terramyces sp. JEL0728]